MSKSRMPNYNPQIRMVAGFVEVLERKEVLVAGACNHPNFNAAFLRGTDPDRSISKRARSSVWRLLAVADDPGLSDEKRVLSVLIRRAIVSSLPGSHV